MLSLDADGELKSCLEALQALQLIRLLEAEVWRYHAVGDDRTCPDCASLDGRVFHVEDRDELLDIFPYGEFIDAYTFKPNTHPNCRCRVVRLWSGE